MYRQLSLDIRSTTPSLLAKWLKSVNSSSEETKILGKKTARAFGLTEKQYRKTLSYLREKIKVTEKLMSENRWNEIEFDKIPSRAGFIYRNAFAKHDVERYEKFISNEETKVNAGMLNPCDIVHAIVNSKNFNDAQVYEKYWDNLKNYFNNATFNGVAVVDTSGSMHGYNNNSISPIDVAISLGLYCANKCSLESPFYGHYISFSRNAKLIEITGNNLIEKINRIYKANLCENTNIRNVFNLILNTAIENNLLQSEMPKNIIIISDMEFDTMTEFNNSFEYLSVMEKISKIYENAGYKMPNLIFWNVDARQDNIPMKAKDGITFVSGYSPVVFEMIMSGKSSHDLVMDKLNSDRYKDIY